jgi:hypothetical protein
LLIEFDDGFIKGDDGRRSARYIEPAYPHTPAGAAPNSPRRERQVAFALRNNSDLLMMSLICGAAGRSRGDLRLRMRRAPADAAPGDDWLEQPPRRPAKGSR